MSPTASRPNDSNVLPSVLGGGCWAPLATTGCSGYSGHCSLPPPPPPMACMAAGGGGRPGSPGGRPTVLAMTFSISTCPPAQSPQSPSSSCQQSNSESDHGSRYQTGLLKPFIYKSDDFTKTGSGQTQGKHSKKDRWCGSSASRGWKGASERVSMRRRQQCVDNVLSRACV